MQFAPGGPIERVIAQLSNNRYGATSRISGSPKGDFGARGEVPGGRGRHQLEISRRSILSIRLSSRAWKQYGFDKPAYERFFIMLRDYLRFDFGKSYFRDVSMI